MAAEARSSSVTSPSDPRMSTDSRESSSVSPSLEQQEVSQDSPSVLERLFHPFRPSLKRRYTANQLSTLHQDSNTASTSSLASSSKSRARSRRSNSSPSRPPSVKSASGSGNGGNGRRSTGASSPGLVGGGTTAGGVSAGPSNSRTTTGSGSGIYLGRSPRSSVDDSNQSRYSPSGSFSYENSAAVSEGGSRPTTRQGPSPLSSPHIPPHLSRNTSTPNLLSPLPGSSTSSSNSRPNLGRRQSSSKRLAAFARPFFRRSSSQRNDIAKAVAAGSSSSTAAAAAAAGGRVTPLSSSVTSISPAATESSGSSGGYVSHNRADTASTASGPPSPAMAKPHPTYGTSSTNGGKRQYTVSSATTRSTSSSHAGSVTTPLAAVDTSHHAHPSPFFAQSTPTSNAPNPFAPPIDCIPILTAALAQPITSTLAQLVPLSLMSPYAPASSLCAPHALGSLPSMSTTSIASSSISDAGTASSIHPSSSSFTSVSPSTSSAMVSNEQLAASSLSIPTTALATVWRQAKASEWVAQHGPALNSLIHNRANPMTPRAVNTPQPYNSASNSPLATAAIPGEEENPVLHPVFDFPAMLQSVLDCLAPISGGQGVDVVYFHGSRHQYYPKNSRPSSSGNGASGIHSEEAQEVQEAFVRADERGLGVAILVMLRQIISDLSPGATLEVGLSTALRVPPSKAAGKKKEQELSNLEPDSDEDEEEDSVNSSLGTYMLTIELTTSNSPRRYPNMGSDTSTPMSETEQVAGGLCSAPVVTKIDPLVCSALFQYLHLSFMTLPVRDDKREYKITCVLPQARPPGRGNPNFEASSRRRKSIDQSRQPSLFELLRFADSSLRGKKVALHALEHSTFAHHLSHHLANWGLEVSHVSIASDDDAESTTGRGAGPGHLGRYDSGFGGSDGPSPPQATATPAALNMNDPMAPAFATHRLDPSSSSSAAMSPPIDPSLNFIIIDDDVASLRKQIMAIKAAAPTLQLQNALLAKRPQLQSRRTRSTQAVTRAIQTPVTIIHFTSLAHYRQIKEIVHATLRNASPMFALPEVLVVPKPAGPRRLLNTLYNAIRRPLIDPHFVPIATSPSSPGAQYFFTGSRPSPAPSNQNEFDAAAAVELSRQRNEQSLSAAVSQVSGPRTPPVPGQVSNPPSPASPDAMEYFSKSASELGSSASQGIIIQSPDGRPTGLFFQPRAASLAEKAESLRMSRNGESDSSSDKESAKESSSSLPKAPKFSPVLAQFQSLTTANGTELPSIVIPDNMDLANARSFSMNKSSPQPTPTPHLSQRSSESGHASVAGESSVKSSRSISGTYQKEDRDSSSDSLDKLPSESKEEPQSPRNVVASPAARSPASPPLDRPGRQPVLSPINTLNKLTPVNSADLKTPVSRDSGDLAQTPPVAPLRSKSERKSSGRIKKAPRRPTGTLVPPINVLIVEDNPINQIILSTFLKRKGIKYSVANNGQEAVDQWKAGDFHLVLMDIQLPVKDGIEATQEIRAMERANNMQFAITPISEASNPISPPSSGFTSPYELPVIIVALTASNLQSDRVNALAAGCNDFLTKPVSLQWLNSKLVEWGSMAYLSGFSSKRRGTVSSPREEFKRSKSLGSQAVELAAKLETEKRKEESASADKTQPPVPSLASQGDQTPRGPAPPEESTPSQTPRS